MQNAKTTRVSLIIIAAIAVIAALKLAEEIMAPLTLAFVIGIVLSPVTDRLERAGLPATLNAVIGLLISLSLLAGLVMAAEPLVQSALSEAPKVLSEMRETVSSFQSALRGLNDMSQEVAETINPDGAAAAAPEEGVAIPTMTDALLFAPALAAQALIFGGTLFFFLLCRMDVYEWIANNNQDVADQADCLRFADQLVARYFLTIALINVGFGLTVFAVMNAIGMPSPLFWGVFAALMNFILYLGPAIVAVCLALAGVVVFDGAMVVAPPILFVFLNMIEGQFVTPTLVGRNLSINPLLVFLSLVLGLWLWGPLGGIVAIPLLLWSLAITGHLRDDQTISSGTIGKGDPSSSAGRMS